MKGGFGETDGLILPFVLSLLALGAIVAFLVLIPTKDSFVTAPSSTGDKKEVTPAGNVILY
jgi:hypothetical protein